MEQNEHPRQHNWRDYEHIVQWVEKMNQWARDYQIYEWIKADDQGLDQSKRVPGWGTVSRPDEEGEIEQRFIWTLWDPVPERYITSEFTSGHPAVFGWYLARVPFDGEKVVLDAGMLACNTCQGEGRWWDADEDEIECEECEGGETSEWVDLEETDFKIGH